MDLTATVQSVQAKTTYDFVFYVVVLVVFLCFSLAIKLSMLKTAVNNKRLWKHYRQCHMQLANFPICVIYPDQLALRSNASSILKMSLLSLNRFSVSYYPLELVNLTFYMLNILLWCFDTSYKKLIHVELYCRSIKFNVPSHSFQMRSFASNLNTFELNVPLQQCIQKDVIIFEFRSFQMRSNSTSYIAYFRSFHSYK